MVVLVAITPSILCRTSASPMLPTWSASRSGAIFSASGT
jgi:hypothetical protein